RRTPSKRQMARGRPMLSHGRHHRPRASACTCTRSLMRFSVLSHHSEDHAMSRYVTVGLSVIAGAALLEVALVPAVVLGCAAVLAPKYVPDYLPKLARHLRPTFGASARRRPRQRPRPAERLDTDDTSITLAGFGIKQAIAKTITFRI